MLKIHGYILPNNHTISFETDLGIENDPNFENLTAKPFILLKKGKEKSIIRVLVSDYFLDLEIENNLLFFYENPKLINVKIPTPTLKDIDETMDKIKATKKANLSILRDLKPQKFFKPDLFF